MAKVAKIGRDVRTTRKKKNERENRHPEIKDESRERNAVAFVVL